MYNLLSIAAEVSGIKSLEFETIHSIWMKAESYLQADYDIVPAPGVNKSMMLSSRSMFNFVHTETGSKYPVTTIACSGNHLGYVPISYLLLKGIMNSKNSCSGTIVVIWDLI